MENKTKLEAILYINTFTKSTKSLRRKFIEYDSDMNNRLYLYIVDLAWAKNWNADAKKKELPNQRQISRLIEITIS